MPEMRAIPTTFDGIEFRSRLEAKWASFFSRIEWHWEYEPFDGNGYIPDFVVTTHDRQLLIEVKPYTELEQYKTIQDKTALGIENRWDGDVLIVGTSPLLPAPYAPVRLAGWHGRTGHYNKWHHGLEQPWNSPTMSNGRDHTPTTQAGWGVSWTEGYWRKRKSDGALTVSPMTDYSEEYMEISWTGQILGIKQHWADAINEVKWRA